MTCERIILNSRVKSAFDIWRADLEVNRIMENAFNKILEINHKHVNARVSSAVSLLSTIFNKQIKSSFSEIYLYEAQIPMVEHRSPTPKFEQSNLINLEEYSSSLHDSTLFLNKLHTKHKMVRGRRQNKSMDRFM